jgi:hypothetical protein
MVKQALHTLRGQRPTLTLSCLWALGIGGTTMMPLQIGSVMRRLHLDEGDATLYSGLEMIGILLGCIALPALARRRPWQLHAAAIMLLFACQLLSSLPLPALLFGALRMLAGGCEAHCIVLAGVCLASHRHAERLWGLVLLLSGLAVAGAFTVLSLLPGAACDTGVWYGLALLALLLGAASWQAPALIPPAAAVQRGRQRIAARVWLAWGMFLAVYSVQAGVWAVSLLQGDRARLPLPVVGTLLALSSLLGFFGAVLPAIPWLARRRALTVCGAALLMLGSAAGFFHASTPLSFFTGQLGLNAAFYAIMAVLNSFISARDSDGTLLSRSVIVTFAAVAFGTLGAGKLFQHAGGAGVVTYSMLALTACIPLAMAVFRRPVMS